MKNYRKRNWIFIKKKKFHRSFVKYKNCVFGKQILLIWRERIQRCWYVVVNICDVYSVHVILRTSCHLRENSFKRKCVRNKTREGRNLWFLRYVTHVCCYKKKEIASSWPRPLSADNSRYDKNKTPLIYIAPISNKRAIHIQC